MTMSGIVMANPGAVMPFFRLDDLEPDRIKCLSMKKPVPSRR
jgi:hypothetical protein